MCLQAPPATAAEMTMQPARLNPGRTRKVPWNAKHTQMVLHTLHWRLALAECITPLCVPVSIGDHDWRPQGLPGDTACGSCVASRRGPIKADLCSSKLEHRQECSLAEASI